VVRIADIFQFVDELARFARPRQIVLFGSYAYGNPTQDSDVDLLVVAEYTGTHHENATRIRQALDVDFPMDLLVRSEAEIRERIGWNDFFLKEIMTKGMVLYAANDAGVGAKGRRRLRRRFDSPALSKAISV
jgi:predicted nucleotidyltransferase